MLHRLTSAACWLCPARMRTVPVAWLAALAAILLTGAASASPRAVSVIAVSAPVMDAAGPNAQELGRAAKGTRLTATGRTSGDWLQIQAPAFISGWVYGELVRDAVIAASSVKVRSGPGIGYPDLGTLTRGDAVVVRGRRGDWIEIEGQPALLAWVERAMVAEGAVVDMTAAAKPPVASPAPVEPAAPPPVEVVPKPLPPPTVSPVPPVAAPPPVMAASPAPSQPKPVDPPPVRPVSPPVAVSPVHRPVMPPSADVQPVPAPTTAMPVERTAVPSRRGASAMLLSPVGVRLLPFAPQGEPVIVSGELRPVGFTLFQPAPYRLVAADGDGPARTLCFVTSPDALPPAGTTVRLQGLKYWVYGSRQPVVLVRDKTAVPPRFGD